MSIFQSLPSTLKPADPPIGAVFYFTDTNQIGVYEGFGKYQVYNRDTVAFTSGGEEELNYAGGIFSDMTQPYSLSVSPTEHFDAERLTAGEPVILPNDTVITQQDTTYPNLSNYWINRGTSVNNIKWDRQTNYLQLMKIKNDGVRQGIEMAFGHSASRVVQGGDPLNHSTHTSESDIVIPGGDPATSVIIWKWNPGTTLTATSGGRDFHGLSFYYGGSNPFGQWKINHWQSNGPFFYGRGAINEDPAIGPTTHLLNPDGSLNFTSDFDLEVRKNDYIIQIYRKGEAAGLSTRWSMNDIHVDHFQGPHSEARWGQVYPGQVGTKHVFYEAMLFDQDLTNTDINKIISYFNNKYQKSVNLW